MESGVIYNGEGDPLRTFKDVEDYFFPDDSVELNIFELVGIFSKEEKQ